MSRSLWGYTWGPSSATFSCPCQAAVSRCWSRHLNALVGYLEYLVHEVTVVTGDVDPEDLVELSVGETRLWYLSEHADRVHLAEDALGAGLAGFGLVGGGVA